jgi:hypothetical protein
MIAPISVDGFAKSRQRERVEIARSRQTMKNCVDEGHTVKEDE